MRSPRTATRESTCAAVKTQHTPKINTFLKVTLKCRLKTLPVFWITSSGWALGSGIPKSKGKIIFKVFDERFQTGGRRAFFLPAESNLLLLFSHSVISDSLRHHGL